MNFEELLDDYVYVRPERGQILEAEILHIDKREVILDAGLKKDAIAPIEDLEAWEEDGQIALAEGDRIPIFITDAFSGEGELRVSIRKGLENEDWIEAETYLENDEILSLEVVDYNRGGVLVKFGSLSGFVPNSHLDEFQHQHGKSLLNTYKETLIGAELSLQVIEVDPQRDRLILSAREAKGNLRDRRLNELQTGDIVSGRVGRLVHFGAFVDLGGVDGLIHVSEMSWKNVERPSDILSTGEEIEVLIKDVDIDRQRISLSRKALQPSPWKTIDERYQIGDLVEGEVVNLRDFGVFVRLGSGLVGLIHKSEIDLFPAERPVDLLEKGEKILAKIIEIDGQHQRIGLSLRQVSDEEQIGWIATNQLPITG
jgi:small subunit ribosomal protein S1